MILLLALLASADDDASDADITVEDHRESGTASTRDLDRVDIEATPARSADELLRAMPGLHLSAHGGRGKAYQLFLRGFDAVHGGDLAVDVDGVPWNEPSNVHAHGYLDLAGLPTLLLHHLHVRPGAFRPEDGDFAIAGSASFELGLADPGLFVRVGGGTDASAQAALSWRPEGSTPGTFVVAEGSVGHGVGPSRAWRQLRVGAGVEGAVGPLHGRAWVLASDGAFESPGVLRVDDVESGTVGFYGSYPGSGGGRSSRVTAAASLSGSGATTSWRGTVWGGMRGLHLSQNTTGWFQDPEHGDGTRQEHRGVQGGMSARGAWVPWPGVAVRGGMDLRADALTYDTVAIDIDGNSLDEATPTGATSTSAGAWVGVDLEPGSGLHVEPGLRFQRFGLGSGDQRAWAPVLAPRLALRLFPEAAVTGYASVGRGFRPPQVQGLGDSRRAPVPTADSAEIGLRALPHPALALRAAGFATLVSNEVVWDHLQARYLATGSTRRLGLDAGVEVRPVDAVRIQLDVTAVHGRQTASGEPIPYAPPFLLQLGVHTLELPVGQDRLIAGVRGRFVGPRPLPGGFTSQASAVVDATATLHHGPWELGLQLDNALATRWRDGEFIYASRWDTTAALSELSVRHFTAGTPFAIRASLGRRF